MNISVIVPAYNEAGRIGSVLEAIDNAELVDQLLVVDDGSTDDTCRKVRESAAQTELISLSNNMG